MTHHLSVPELSEFITGQAAEHQQARIVRHLETCETCLNTIDSMWSETMSALQKTEITHMESGRRMWLRRRILRRIHSFETDRSVAQLLLLGPQVLAKGLLEPWRKKTKTTKDTGGSQ